QMHSSSSKVVNLWAQALLVTHSKAYQSLSQLMAILQSLVDGMTIHMQERRGCIREAAEYGRSKGVNLWALALLVWHTKAGPSLSQLMAILQSLVGMGTIQMSELLGCIREVAEYGCSKGVNLWAQVLLVLQSKAFPSLSQLTVILQLLVGIRTIHLQERRGC